jgi:Tfp pilus assembly protein PilO
MNNRYWVVGTVVLVGAVAALGWFAGIQPALQAATATDAARVDVEAQNALYEAQLVQLREDYEHIDILRAEVQELRAVIPDHADYAGFVAELNALAGTTATTVTNVVIGDATWYTAAPTDAAPPPTTEPTPTADAAASDAAAADAGAAAAASDDGTAQVLPLPGADGSVNGSNFIAIPVQLQVTGDYLSFIRALQANPRLFLVTGFSAVKDAPTSVSGLLYVLLGDPIVAEVAE